VHVTLGVVPVFVAAYAVAVARRSARWSFAGDVAVWVGGAITILTVASGLVSNALVDWPGGSVETWRWLHLGLAALSAALLVALGWARLRAVRHGALASRRTLAGALVLAVLLGATGWIGGEVLVFHSGIAVTAAGDGAYAPPTSRSLAPPKNLHDAMGRLRASWGEAETTFARMLVHRPSANGYARIAAAAQELSIAAAWLEEAGSKAMASDGHSPGEDASGSEAASEMAWTLHKRTRELEQAAKAESWSSVTRALEDVTSSCATCHETVRWRGERGDHDAH